MHKIYRSNMQYQENKEEPFFNRQRYGILPLSGKDMPKERGVTTISFKIYRLVRWQTIWISKTILKKLGMSKCTSLLKKSLLNFVSIITEKSQRAHGARFETRCIVALILYPSPLIPNFCLWRSLNLWRTLNPHITCCTLTTRPKP